ncbi:MAG: hypothetical protein OXH52_13280 [Gammaproteobacteria bacterium]|nr:hypothetical protein [Gammaproteobacteria bacterium]
MRRLSTLFISMFLAYFSQSAMAGGWGAVFAIELRGDGLEQPIEITDPSAFERLRPSADPSTDIAIQRPWIEHRGDGLEQPIEITDPSILERLSFWVGPGTNMTDFMRPDGTEKSIVDWDASVVCDEPADLQRIEVKFRMGWTPESRHAFFVLYGMEPEGSAGYIYYPHANYILTHFSEGTWRHASDRWNKIIGSIIEKHTIAGAEGEFSCRVQGADPDTESCWPERPSSPPSTLTAQRP